MSRIPYLISFIIMLFLPIAESFGQERDFSETEYDKLVDDLGYNDTKKALRLKKQFVPKDLDAKEEDETASFSGGGLLLQLVAYMLMLALVVIILYLIFSNVKLDKKIDVVEVDYDEIEDIEDIDADAAYKAAVAKGDYRLAIRMQFIRCLQILSAKERIEWEKEKTNRDYTREIKNTEMKRSFRELATVFERSWYGEVAVDVSSFRIYDQKFLTFFNSMK